MVGFLVDFLLAQPKNGTLKQLTPKFQQGPPGIAVTCKGHRAASHRARVSQGQSIFEAGFGSRPARKKERGQSGRSMIEACRFCSFLEVGCKKDSFLLPYQGLGRHFPDVNLHAKVDAAKAAETNRLNPISYLTVPASSGPGV